MTAHDDDIIVCPLIATFQTNDLFFIDHNLHSVQKTYVVSTVWYEGSEGSRRLRLADF